MIPEVTNQQVDAFFSGGNMDIFSSSFWILSAGVSLIIVILSCAIYFWYKNRLRAVLKDSEDIAELAQRKLQLNSEIEQCQTWLNSNKEELLRLDAERQQQEFLRQDLANLQTKAAQEQQKLSDIIKETNDLQNVVTVLSQDRDRLVQEKSLLEKEKIEGEKAARELEGVITRYKEEKAKFDDLLQNLAKDEIKLQSLVGELSARESQLSQMKSELKQVEERLVKAKSDLIPLEEVLAEKERVRRDRDLLLEEVESLQQNKTKLKREEEVLEKRVIALRAETGTDAQISSRYEDLLETIPKCLDNEVFPGGKQEQIDERRLLKKLKDELANQGLIFSDRTINAFHTSLKINEINPLTVLAGVSGTGKTLLPIRYAEILGMHRLVISVQPRWDSPQDLFGFYNYLEHQYKATDLARALIRLDRYNFKELSKGLEDRMILVLLDEMNLARVEYYFSEFLSKLELRREVKDEANSVSRAKAEIELDAGPGKIDGKSLRLWISKNIIFVGTMNEDESTQTLSDKVLDRANVLRFGKPGDRVPSQQLPVYYTQDKFLSYSQWQTLLKKYSPMNAWSKEITDWTVTVNRALEKIGRPFGHRVNQAIKEYVANYPGVEDGKAHKDAFADQIEQKIIPKLRGIDLAEQNSIECLQEICELIDASGDVELRDSFTNSMDDKTAGTFVWRGVTRS